MQGTIHWNQKEQVKGSFMASPSYDYWSYRVPFSFTGKMDLAVQQRMVDTLAEKARKDPRFGRAYNVVTIDPVSKIIVVQVQQKV